MEELEKLNINKHIAAIHCSNNISLLQRKVYNVLLFRAYSRLLEDDFHYISLSELSKLIAYNSKDTAKLKAVFRSLQSTTVEWNILEKGDAPGQEIWCSSALLASAVIDRKRGFCRYEYSKTLASLLFQPDIYARIDLNIQNRFRSSYGLALYENCVRFKRVKTTGWISIETFRKLMGVSPNKYKKFCDFNRRVLVPAVTEINELSDIRVELETRRMAQKVLSLKFHITTKQSKKPLGLTIQAGKNTATPKNCKTADLLREKFSARKGDIDCLTKNYSLEYINEKVEMIASSASFRQGKVRVPLAFLKSALKDNYVLPTQEVEKTIDKPGIKFTQKEQQIYDLYCEKYIMERFNALRKSEQQRMGELFSEQYRCSSSNSDQLIYQLYSLHGVKSVRREFIKFVISMNPDLGRGIRSIEAYLQEKE